MSKSKLVCTVELDLPDDLTQAHALQAPLLSMWKQFTDAMGEQGVKGARTDARVVKTKAPKALPQTPPNTPLEEPAEAERAMPAFLKRT